MTALKKNRIHRRTLLRCAAGGLGTAIALPSLEAMFGSDSAYAAEAQGAPRFLAIYQPNGHHNEPFHPTVNGDIRNLGFAGKNSAPLEPWLKSNRATILKNLLGAQNGYDDGQDKAASSSGNDHLVAIVSWLTGKPVPSAKDNSHSVSMDAFLADRYEQLYPTGRSQHVVISGSPFVDPGRMDYNNEQKDWVSTDRNGKKIFAVNGLKSVMDKIFAGFDPNVTDLQRQQRLAFRKSMLDFVKDDMARLEQRLGVADRRVLDSYFQDVRALEQRLVGGPAAPVEGCAQPNVTFSREWPTERKNDLANPYIDEHWRDTTALLSVAFRCEAVRSVAYMLETEAGESGYSNAQLGDSHAASHGLSSDYGKRDKLHAELFSEMLGAFDQQAVGPSSLLDSTMVLWGAGIGEVHSRDQQMAVIAGYTGGKIKHGALRDFQNKASSVLLPRTLLSHLGVLKDDEKFGLAKPGQELDLTS